MTDKGAQSLARTQDQKARDAGDPEGEAAGPQVDRIAALVERVRAGANGAEGREAADALTAALRLSGPSQETRDLLHGLLDRKELDDFVDSAGISCRAAVIEAQVALGFPFALEVSPDDLAFLRKSSKEGLGRSRALRFMSGLSVLWNVALAVFTLKIMADVTSIPAVDLLALPFVVGAGHAVYALVTSVRARSHSRRKTAARYRTLAWMGLLGPVLSVGAGLFAGITGFVGGMAVATPAMTVAALCAIAAKKVLPDRPAAE